VSEGLVPSEAVKENVFYALPLASGGFLSTFYVLCLRDASPQSLHSCSHSILLPVHPYPNFSFLQGCHSYWMKGFPV